MKRFDPDYWSGLFVVLICVGVGLPVPLLARGADFGMLVPVALWTGMFAAFIAVLVACAVLMDGPRHRLVRGVFGVQVVLGAGVVLAAPGAGWLPILLVFTTALGTYVVGLRASWVVLIVNTAVIAAATWINVGERVEVGLTAVLYALLQIVSVLSVAVQIREAAMRAELTEAHVELRAASALLAESTRADERLRIARELHDLLGHQLTVLTLELETASHQSGAEAVAHVERAKGLARDLLGDVRATVGELRLRAPDLRETVGAIVRELPEPEVRVRIDDDVQADEEQTAALVRCVQEIVTNTIRHAGASRLDIAITTDGAGGLRLSAVDDGHGSRQIDVGNGLRGITERVEALGGQARFAGDDGFRVLARVPAP